MLIPIEGHRPGRESRLRLRAVRLGINSIQKMPDRIRQHGVARIVGMEVIGGNGLRRQFPCRNPGMDIVLDTDAGQIIIPAHGGMNLLRADPGAEKGIVDQHHRGQRLGSIHMAHQSLIGLLKMGVIFIVHAELYKNQIWPGIEQVLIHPGHAKLGSSCPDARIVIFYSGLGIFLLPPLTA